MNATSINENDKITQYTCHFFIANGLSKLKKKKTNSISFFDIYDSDRTFAMAKISELNNVQL